MSEVPLYSGASEPGGTTLKPEVSYERGTPVGSRVYRGTSLIRKRTPLGPYPRPMPRVLGRSWGGGDFLMGEVPLYADEKHGQNSFWALNSGLRVQGWGDGFRPSAIRRDVASLRVAFRLQASDFRLQGLPGWSRVYPD